MKNLFLLRTLSNQYKINTIQPSDYSALTLFILYDLFSIIHSLFFINNSLKITYSPINIGAMQHKWFKKCFLNATNKLKNNLQEIFKLCYINLKQFNLKEFILGQSKIATIYFHRLLTILSGSFLLHAQVSWLVQSMKQGSKKLQVIQGEYYESGVFRSRM
jgi:hypothetical protein